MIRTTMKGCEIIAVKYSQEKISKLIKSVHSLVTSLRIS